MISRMFTVFVSALLLATVLSLPLYSYEDVSGSFILASPQAVYGKYWCVRESRTFQDIKIGDRLSILIPASSSPTWSTAGITFPLFLKILEKFHERALRYEFLVHVNSDSIAEHFLIVELSHLAFANRTAAILCVCLYVRLGTLRCKLLLRNLVDMTCTTCWS